MSLGTIGPLLVLGDHRPFENWRKLEDALKMRLTRSLTNERSSRSSRFREVTPSGTVNGDNILAFEDGVDWDIVPLAGAGRLAGGAFNVVLHGTGKVAVTAQGYPVLLDTSPPPPPTPTRP